MHETVLIHDLSTHAHTHAHAHTYTHTHVHTHTHAHTRAHTRTHTHTMHTHTHTHTHTQEYVSLQHLTDSTDVAEKLITEGVLRVDKRREKRLAKLVSYQHNHLINILKPSLPFIKRHHSHCWRSIPL